MQLPGFIYSAFILALVTFLQAISGGLESSTELWAPVAVAVVAAALKALEAYAAKDGQPQSAARSLEQPRGFWNRFLLG